jgi:parallel beta-helix repeat protein
MTTTTSVRVGPTKPVSLALALALLVMTFTVALSGNQALAGHLTCGDTITEDAELDNDLTNCPGNGIVIGANNITLDLNGHTIDGDAVLGCSEDEFCDFGVDNTAGHEGVTIEGGSIRDFATGIFVLGANHNRLRRLSLSNNLFGGLLLVGSMHSQIERNSISANGLTTDQAGLIIFDSSNLRIERNSVTGNGDIGMFVIGVDDSRVERNSVSGNPEAGVILEGAGNEVSRNRVSQNGDGLIVTGDGNTVTRNDVSDAVGCPDGCGFGISFEGGEDNLIERNIVARSREAGIRIADFEPEGPPAVGNVVRRNLILDAGIDGVFVESTATDTLLERNIAIGAGDDGIDVDNSATTLTRNRADRNHDLGIEAVPGVTDGGGNRAEGNGNPVQCTNVACS